MEPVNTMAQGSQHDHTLQIQRLLSRALRIDNDVEDVFRRGPNPRYSQVDSRRGTFRGWPKIKTPRPAELAEAGFWYTGYRDRVDCFYCGVVVGNWEPGQDPWTVHKKNCEFVQRQRPTSGQGVQPDDGGEVSARMDTPIVQKIINMGYPYKTVWAVIENRLWKTGDDFPNASSLLEAIFAYGGVQPDDGGEVKARMDTPIVQKIIAMGYSYEAVSAVIEKKLRKTGDDFRDALSLVEAIFEYEKAKSQNTFIPY